MAQIAYLALDDAGREVRGGIEAADRPGAAALLRGRGLFPLELREDAPRAAAGPAAGGWSLPALVTSGDLALFLSQMALMLRTGLTILQSLETLARRGSRRALRQAAARLSRAVQAGSPLSAALAQERLFPPLVHHLVRTAEATGELEQAFTRSAEFIERRAALRFQLITTLIYPSIVVLLASGVFVFLTTSVVPKMARFFAGRGRSLPWSTQKLMDLSELMQRHGLTLLGVLGALVGSALLAYRTERGRYLLDRASLRVPGLALLLRTAAMAHLGRTLSLLLRSGLPLLESLRVLSGSFAHRAYRALISRCAERVIQGETLAGSLAQDGAVTPLCLQVVAVGEQSGSLDQVLGELGEFYEQRLQRLLSIASSLVEPAILIALGGMVGFVYISFFQAVFQLAMPR